MERRPNQLKDLRSSFFYRPVQKLEGFFDKRSHKPLLFWNLLKLIMHFKVIGEITEAETIAAGRGIKNLNRLQKIYGKTNWRKLKGKCRVKLKDGSVVNAEVHWYEGHGIG